MKHVLKEMFGELTPFGKFWLYIGLATLGAAAAMSFDFGWTVSWKHALFLALLSIITAFAPEAAYRQFTEGRKGAGIAVAVVCAPLFLIEFYSHAGYTAGQRGVNMGEARVQNATYTGTQNAVSEDEESLQKAKTSLEQLKLAFPWAATVTADSLRAQIPAIDEKLRQEEQRGGCGPKCLAIKAEKADIESRIATAEERNNITSRISELEKRLGERRTTAATTEFKHSSVDYMNGFLASAVATVTGQEQATTKLEKKADLSANVGMALAGTGLPGLAIFIAGLYRVKRRTAQSGADFAAAAEPVTASNFVGESSALIRPAREMQHAPHQNVNVSARTKTIADLRRSLQAIGGTAQAA